MDLNPAERKILEVLKRREIDTIDNLKDETGIEVVSVAETLRGEGLVKRDDVTEDQFILTEDGKQAIAEGFPEVNVLETVDEGDGSIEEIQELEFANIGIGKARSKGLIRIEDGTITLTNDGQQVLDEEYHLMEELHKVQDEKSVSEDVTNELLQRGLIEQKEKVINRKLKITDAGQELDLDSVQEAQFDVTAPVNDAKVGRKHFTREVYDFVRNVWVEMGFQEMQGPLIVPSLLNFDALYTPQDHPARELHDTFFMKNPKSTDISEYSPIVDRIKSTHEDGWETGSKGWGYSWSREEAEKNVLRTHTTAVSAKTISELTEDDLPAKFFSVDRNFRNEAVDDEHLPEFNQSEGIVISHDVNFKNLKGYLRQFFSKLIANVPGYTDVRLRPAYYPYTELSIEPDVYDKDAGEWIGLGGSGMFRPEVVKPLIGFEVPVLAWGLGPGRLIKRARNIDDIRKSEGMKSNDLGQLQNTQGWVR